MRKTLTLATFALLAAAAAPALHAADPKPEAKTKLTPEEQASYRLSAEILRAFTVAFEAKEVQAPVKGRLLSCLYNNKLSTIANATSQVIANNSGLSDTNPTDVYRAAAGVCGVQFKQAAADGAKSKDEAKPKAEAGR